jgi:hypothetical protein
MHLYQWFANHLLHYFLAVFSHYFMPKSIWGESGAKTKAIN